MDHVDATKRSEMMRSVGQKNTKPEVTLRSALHARGLRYRLHRKDLKGRPDIVFPKYGTCMFVHGCFWHRHGCSRSTTPKSNSSFWHDKFRANVARDRRAVDELLGAGWRVLTVWECGILGKGRAEEAAAFIQEWLKTDKLEGEYPFPQASDQSHAM